MPAAELRSPSVPIDPAADMLGRHFGCLCAGLAAFMLLGCMPTDEVRSAFSSEFNCPEDDVTIERISPSLYEARGCFASESYRCEEGNCVAQSPPKDEASSRLAPPRKPGLAVTAPPAEESKPTQTQIVTLDLPIGNSALLKLRGVPEKQRGVVQIYLARNENDPELEKCKLQMMINGSPVALPQPRFSRKATLSALATKLPADFLRDLGGARQLALRACNLRWSLTDEQLGEVNRFVMRYEEELAWSSDPAKEGSGGLLTPTGGWPAWKVSGTSLPGAQAKVHDSEALFKLLSPSIFQVEALQATGTSQGSAVAISKTELLTNCHVVQGARKILIKQQKKEWVVNLTRSEPKSDRCVLELSDGELKPVGGVRSYSDLRVGEPLYTLGSPSGFELTLSNGILSGLREEDGRHYVQTTAPISPGSSGGGLFDARGNLVGITTLAIVNRQRTTQALNFAIAADSFWQQ